MESIKRNKRPLLSLVPTFAALGVAVGTGWGKHHYAEPFDFPAHLGDAILTAPFSVGLVDSELAGKTRNQQLAHQNRAFALGAAVVTAANFALESKYGTAVFNALTPAQFLDNTADMIDAVYGAAYGTMCAFVASRIHPSR